MEAEYYYSHFNKDFRERVENLRDSIKSHFGPIREDFRKYYIAYSKNKVFCYIWFTSKNVYVYLGVSPVTKKGLQKVPRGVHNFFKSRYLFKNSDQTDEVIKLIKKSLNQIS